MSNNSATTKKTETYMVSADSLPKALIALVETVAGHVVRQAPDIAKSSWNSMNWRTKLQVRIDGFLRPQNIGRTWLALGALNTAHAMNTSAFDLRQEGNGQTTTGVPAPHQPVTIQ